MLEVPAGGIAHERTAHAQGSLAASLVRARGVRHNVRMGGKSGLHLLMSAEKRWRWKKKTHPSAYRMQRREQCRRPSRGGDFSYSIGCCQIFVSDDYAHISDPSETRSLYNVGLITCSEPFLVTRICSPDQIRRVKLHRLESRWMRSEEARHQRARIDELKLQDTPMSAAFTD